MKVSLHPARAFSKDALIGRPGSVTPVYCGQGQMLAGRMALEISRLFIASAPCIVPAMFGPIRIGVGLDLDVSLDAKKFKAYYLVVA